MWISTKQELKEGLQSLKIICLNGYNPAVGTSEEYVNPLGAVIAFPTTAQTTTISSTSASDTSAGTGARTVTVIGLDSNWDEVSEVVTLNGTSAVTLANQYVRVNCLQTASAGSGGANVGNIYVGYGTVTNGVPANIQQLMAAGANDCNVSVYTVPNNQKALLRIVHMFSSDPDPSSKNNQLVRKRLMVRDCTTNISYQVFNINSVASSADLSVSEGIYLPEKHEFYFLATGTSSAEVSIVCEIIQFKE